MELFISIEAQNTEESGLAQILTNTIKELGFVTDSESNLENDSNYGTEFKSIAVIPSCMEDRFWNALGWKERKLILRKNKEADIRLRMDYSRFMSETVKNRRLMFIAIIIESIMVVMERSRGDFRGKKLINDIVKATDVSVNQLSPFLSSSLDEVIR